MRTNLQLIFIKYAQKIVRNDVIESCEWTGEWNVGILPPYTQVPLRNDSTSSLTFLDSLY